MPRFPHLPFLRVLTGTHTPKPNSFPRPSERSKGNRGDLARHGTTLAAQVATVKEDWKEVIQQRHELGFYEADGAEAIPLFLQVDPASFDPTDLRAWGIDVVSVEANGFIIAVATSIEFPELTSRIAKMVRGKYVAVNIAELWEVQPRGQSVELVVAPSLWQRWASLEDETECLIEVSVSIDLTNPGPQPILATDNELKRWRKLSLAWDEEKDKRVERLEKIISFHKGEILDQIDQIDTTDYYIKVSGKCVKDIAFNFPYALDITEWDLASEEKEREEILFHEYDVELLAPSADAPKVCIIDSGFQSGHRLLASAIDVANSRSYLPIDNSTADKVVGGGHGTRVAGAVLYPNGVPRSGTVQAVAWLQNARVLDEHNVMGKLFPAGLIRKIVSDYRPTGTRIFNMSIQTLGPCRTSHMSSWAAEIDQRSFDNDVLFIVSAGNIWKDDWHSTRLGVSQHIAAGRNYPDYLREDSSRVGNPAQSCQALTVGSVCYDQIVTTTHKSFGTRDQPSAFSRTGLGMWGMIKPDVVEYGGDYVQTAANTFVSNIPEANPELVTSTLGGHPPVSRTNVGTSFAAPKVAHIAAALAAALPGKSTLLYRALIVQSAQWPIALEADTQENKLFHFRTLGYGIPSVERALENSEARITFINEESISAGEAHLFGVKLGDLLDLADPTDYRIEVTLSYAARPRRTRQKLRNYVSTRLEWKAANLGQTLESFSQKVNLSLERDTEDDTSLGVGEERLFWQVNTQINSQGSALKVRRQDSTLQKDWAIVKGFKLIGERMLFAVTAHKGWDIKDGPVPYAFTVSITSMAGVPIYERLQIANTIEVNV